MTTISTHCQSCGVGIQAPANMAGHSAQCPKCGNEFVIGFVTTTERPPIDPADIDESFTPIEPSIDISDLYFESRDHNRYNSGEWTGADNNGCGRAIEVKTHPEFANSFLVTVYNLDDVHPVWGTNVQIAGKRMRVIESDDSHITLRGHGIDPMGFPFSNYGITLHLNGGDVDHISLYYHDRDVRLDYFKNDSPNNISSSSSGNPSQKEERDEALDYMMSKFAEYATKRKEVGDIEKSTPEEAMKFRQTVIDRVGYCGFDVGQLMAIIDARRSIGKTDSEIVRDLIRCQ